MNRWSKMLAAFAATAALGAAPMAMGQYEDDGFWDLGYDQDYGYENGYDDWGWGDQAEVGDMEYEYGEGWHEQEWYDPSDWGNGDYYDADYGYGVYDDDYEYYEDDYGVYDNNYEWETDDGWFNDWYGNGDDWW